MQISSRKLIVGGLKIAQRVLGVVPSYSITKLHVRSSDNHETSTPARMSVRAGKPGYFSNLGYPLIKGEIMKKIMMMLVAGVMLSGCYATTGTITKKDVSTVGGCVAGGVVGSKVGSGSGKTAATILGTLAGCKAGNVLGEKIENK